MVIALVFIVLLCTSCQEEKHCFNCVGTQEVTINVDYPGYPQTIINETMICDMTEDEAQNWAKENTSAKTTYYLDIELKIATTWECQ